MLASDGQRAPESRNSLGEAVEEEEVRTQWSAHQTESSLQSAEPRLTVGAIQRVLAEPLATAALVVGPQRCAQRLQPLRLAHALALQPGGRTACAAQAWGTAGAQAAFGGPGLLCSVLIVAKS